MQIFLLTPIVFCKIYFISLLLWKTTGTSPRLPKFCQHSKNKNKECEFKTNPERVTCRRNFSYLKNYTTAKVVFSCSWSLDYINPEEILNNFQFVQKLTIRNGNVTEFLTDFPKSKYLQTLILVDLNLKKLRKNLFAYLENLKFLDLSHNRLKYFSPEIIKAHPSLLKVILIDNPWNCSSDLKWILDKSINLKLANKNLVQCGGNVYPGKPVYFVMSLIKKYCESQDALLFLFLPNENYHAEESNNSSVDYLREFQGTCAGIDSTATSKQLIFKTDLDENADEWKSKDLKDWTSSDVLHWIASVAENQKFPYEFVNANAFNVDGKTLLSFSKKDFIESDEKYGSVLYQALHKTIPKFEEMSTPYKPESGKSEVKLETLSTTTNLSERFISYASKKDGPPYGLVSGPNPYPSDLTNSPESYPFDLGTTRDEGDTFSTVYNSESKNSDASFSSDTEQSDVEFKKQSKKSGLSKRPPGRPPGVKAKKEKPEKKTGRLWEFIRDLLLDPQHCPSVICWENHDDGVFRFVKSEKVAKIWGDRKGNEKMNYEKLSRAMRYYYRSKVLQPVIGRRLVYKFGPTARGWKTENPNFRH